MDSKILKGVALGLAVALASTLILAIEFERRVNVLEGELGQIRDAARDAEIEFERRVNVLEGELSQFRESYQQIRVEVNSHFGFGLDATSFVSPEDPVIDAKAVELAGYYSASELWGDYERLFRWVMDEVEYSSDTPLPWLPATLDEPLVWRKDYWRMPSETISDMKGDCEDQALLLASLIGAYNGGRYACWVVSWVSEEVSHLAVAIPVVGDKLVILDPAGRFYTRSMWGNLVSKDIGKAVEEWLDYWAEKYLHPEVHKVFTDRFIEEFESTQEFVLWAYEQY